MVEQYGPASAWLRSNTLTSSRGSFIKSGTDHVYSIESSGKRGLSLVSVNPGALYAVGVLEGGDLGFHGKRQADFVQAFEQHLLVARRDLEVHRIVDPLVGEVDGEGLCIRYGSFFHQILNNRRRKNDRQQAVLEAVVEEDLAEGGGDDAAHAHAGERPDGHFARAAGAEEFAADDDLRIAIARLVEDEVRILFPVGQVARHLEGVLAELFLRHAGAALDADDQIRIDVLLGEGCRDRRQGFELVHENPLTSVISPASAAAAAIAGLARWVRAFGPWRPTKFRLEVETQRASGSTRSPFTPTHMEQPASRHSKPASRNTWCSPSASASCLMRQEPGTTQPLTCFAALRPRTIADAARRSGRRELVQEPMNTRSTFVPAIGFPSVRPM